MTIKTFHIFLFVVLVLTICQSKIKACSMYKITINGKTMVGCNHDAWLTTPKIWFKNAKQPNEYGVGFTGAREVYGNKTAPQSGMNTMGLAFSRLASYYPKQENPFTDKLKISDEVEYLTDILHKCANVEEVKRYIEQYDHSSFIDAIFIYIDRSGDYLIVEPYKLIKGNNPSYVLANFCPSITNNQQARKFDRYRKGEDFLKVNKINPSLDYCTALSDTMHVCRTRNGDGTLLTSIWDTENKMINLYFYHSYDTIVQFSLTKELAKGDHIISIPKLFPKNSEFERLLNYKTPANTVELRIALVIFAGLLALFFLVMGIYQIQKNKPGLVSLKSVAIILLLNLVLIAYITILVTNKSIFYFDVPYKHHNSSLISTSSYTPFLLLLLFLPISIYTVKVLKSYKIKIWLKVVLASNNLIYFVLILGFTYWGLYNFWN